MAVRQLAASVQNDGNWAQLDLRDVDFKGPLMRIETYRCSQPEGEFGTTASGTSVVSLAGLDHLRSDSNRTFRNVFSVASSGHQKVTLELREQSDEMGALEVRTRDLDPGSPSFGTILVSSATPLDHGRYRIVHRFLRKPKVTPVEVRSPLTARIVDIVPGLVDLGEDISALGTTDEAVVGNPMQSEFAWTADVETVEAAFHVLAGEARAGKFSVFAKNVQVYLRFGDFRDKAVHPGTNLTGDNPQLASEYITIRGYRKSMIMLGRLFDRDMQAQPTNIMTLAKPLQRDRKAGVYSVFLSAYLIDVDAFQLGIDKAHSDYGGIPMSLAPGSRLETGRQPIVDATNVGKTLAQLSVAFYVSASRAMSMFSAARL